MEEIACGRVRTRPDGRGKQHDVGRRKARHRDRTDQLLQNGIPFPLTVREDVRLVAALADRAHQFSTVAALSSDLCFQTIETRRVERLTRARSTVRLGSFPQRRLDGRDASTAVNAGHAEIRLAKPASKCPARQPKLFGRREPLTRPRQ